MADYHDGVSNLPISSKYRSLPDKPISESEREDFAARLNEEFARGTLDQDDYRRLLDTVFAARTNGDLLPVAEKLPVRQTYDQPGIVAAALERLEKEGPVDRSRSVMIGDREYDAAGARASGLACLGVGWGFGTPEELLGAGAEAVCADAAELQRRILARVAGTEPAGAEPAGTGPAGTGPGAGSGAGGVVDEAADGAS